MGERQSRWRQHEPQLRLHEPREPLGRQPEHVAGEGTEHSNVYGGSSAHAYGGGTEHTNMYGGSTYGKLRTAARITRIRPGATAYHPPGYPAYPTYPGLSPASRGALLLVGMLRLCGRRRRGRRHGGRRRRCVREYGGGNIERVQRGSRRRQRETAAATTAAYAAGVAAGATAAAAPASGAWVMGMNYATIPAGCAMPNVGSGTFYLCGNTWFKPAVRRQRRVLHGGADAVEP